MAEMKTVFKPSGKTDFRSRVEELAGALRGHLQPVEVEEDDEKVMLTMKPCGAGERIMEMGGYEHGVGMEKVKDPHPVTWGIKNFPIYCVHCPILEMLAVEGTGQLGAVRLVSDPMVTGKCHFALYKNPDDIPERFYSRIGKKKPVKD